MGAQSDQKKVSISSANPIVISNTPPVSEPSGLLYLAVVISLLGAVGLGFVIGYMSPVIDKIKPATFENEEARSWMGSITPLGALFGGLLAPVLIKFLGKKKALISHGLPFTVGWACFVFDSGEQHTLFYIGRLLTGLCCGLVCGTAPGYVSEISTVNKRGLLGSCFQLFITLGILFAGVIGNMTNYKVFAIISAIPSFLMSCLMLFMPESPVQILSNQLNDETIDIARKELTRLRSPNSTIEAELNQMVASQKAMNEIGDEGIGTKIGKVDFYKPLTYSLMLMLIQQMSGVNAILFYANTIFESASPGINLAMASAVLCGMQSLATFGEMFIVEKLGRRILLIASGCGCSLGLGVMGIFYFMKEKDPTIEQTLAWLPLVTLVFYIIAFSMGLAPVPWLMVPELTPTNNRAFISGVATAFNWFIAFLVTKFFGPIQTAIGAYSVYFIFMTHTIIGVALLLVFLPETGGKNLDEITRRYAYGWKNSLFVATSSKRDSIALEANRQNTSQLNADGNRNI